MPPADHITDATPLPSAEDMRDGTLTVRQAEEFSGLSRNRLWDLMDAETIDWFPDPDSGRGTRLIVRQSLVNYLESLRERGRAMRLRKAMPRPRRVC